MTAHDSIASTEWVGDARYDSCINSASSILAWLDYGCYNPERETS